MVTSLIRTLILYFFIIFSLRVLGKRQLGELQPAELVTSLLISDLAAVPMQDLGIPLVQGIVPILTLFATELLISAICARSVRARNFFCGRTSILIRHGVINQRELRRQRINVTELLEELRLKDVFSLDEVGCAYLETNGALSVQLAPMRQPVTPELLKIDTDDAPMRYTTLIAQGRMLRRNLAICGRDEAWVLSQLRKNGMKSPSEVYLFVCDDRDGVMLVPREHAATHFGEMEG